MPSPDLTRSQAKIEDIPSDGGRVVDTLAGGLLRSFARLNQIERAYRELSARVVQLEGRNAPPLSPRPFDPADPGARRVTHDGRVDTRGSTAASRIGHKLKR